jgi:hypothetical protein
MLGLVRPPGFDGAVDAIVHSFDWMWQLPSMG